MAIQLVTFGGLHVVDDGGDLERLLAQHSRAALFIYLAVERRVSRESLTAVFWPESDAENARHALRQSLYQLRKAVGGGELIDSRAHELVMSDEVQVDAQGFTAALECGDAASAVRLYRGAFLDGVHLVDLKSWENWVDSRRAQYSRAFRKACRDLLEHRSTAGDLAGAIEAAELWTARDPSDDEAQHRLIESLAAAGERAEAIRQYETYERMLEPDGLEPRVETRALVERLRSAAPPLPTLVTARAATDPSVPPKRPASAAPASRRPLRWRPFAAAGALIGLVATAWGLRSTRFSSAPAASTTAIAVFPFSVRGAQTADYLGDGMVNLLGRAIDGAGPLRPVDTRATFAAVAEVGGNMTDARHANRVAAKLGAARFVLGDVVEAGRKLQIEAAVYDLDGQTESRAAVSGAADSVFDLVDKLAARLLGGLGDQRTDRLTRTASLTTTSLPAFKAYLQGEQEMRAGQFERAADDYLAAIALDSTFAVAHYHLALAREWAPLPGIEDAADAASRYGARLSARDRMLLEAFRQWRIGNAFEADRAYRTILARYPDDVDAWFQLAEIQFHHGPLLGRRLDESEEAWRKVLGYEPRNLFALTHLARIATVTNRRLTLDSLLARYSSDELRTDRRLAELAVLRAVLHGDSTAALALAQNVRRAESFAAWRIAVFLTAFTPDPAIMRAVIEELMEDDRNVAMRADITWFASLLDLAGGHVNVAAARLAAAAASERAVSTNLRRQGFGPVTEWFAATLPLPYADSTLVRARLRAASAQAPAGESRAPFVGELKIGAPIQLEPLRQYAIGLLSLRLRDTTSAVVAATSLQQRARSPGATTLTRDLDRGLRARLTWQRGRPQEALRLLDSLELRDIQGDINVTPFAARANERFLRGDVLASLGRYDEALGWFASLGDGSVTEIPMRAPAHLRQAEIYERLGNRDRASWHYARAIELWRDADGIFQPAVIAARGRLASLR